MRALRRFTVRAALPAPLATLDELVQNLRWCWHSETMDLFASIDPDLWERTAHDPIRLLGDVDPARLDQLAEDKKFLRRVEDAADDLREYLQADRWYQSLGPDLPGGIAYFSMEYGIAEVLPQYSGGLGILAGDHLKTASDLGVPIVGVGLLYRAGYFVQGLSRDGWQTERYPGLDPHGLPLSGTDIAVSVDLPGGRVLHAQVWKAQVGRVPLLLLDSDVEANGSYERSVTDRLYGGGTDHRLLQEMLLGIGGVRALRAYTAAAGMPQPEVFHANEGHAGFGGLERVRELMVGGLSFDEALAAVRAATVFTTHTPVPAGIDRFPRELVAAHFGEDAALGPVPLERVLELGAEDDPDVYNMAHLGLRLAQRANGVARLHGAVSRTMFGGLWPGFDATEVPITSVTNGVHAPTWVAREMQDLAAVLDKTSDAALWATRRALRARLVTDVRARLRESWLIRGAGEAELGWTETAFDPDVLTVGFARRVPSYKRLTLMLQDPERLAALLLDPERPIQMIIAGKAHPADEGGKELVQQIVAFADREDVRHRIAFLPGYDMRMAKVLYPGCDVWLNNPLRPLEACGTSGMKAALNGVLNLSIRDGWWDEMFDGQNGWAIATADGVEDPVRRDELEAGALYDLLENAVAPRFYGATPGGSAPTHWLAMVRHTLATLGPQVLADRMLAEYVTQLYAPAARSSRALRADGYGGAKELSAWTARVRTHWPEVAVLHVESGGDADVPVLGQPLPIRAVVALGPLSVEDVEVQVAYGTVDENDDVRDIETLPMLHTGFVDGGHRFEVTLRLSRSGPFGYTVRVLPRHPLLPNAADLGLVVSA